MAGDEFGYVAVHFGHGLVERHHASLVRTGELSYTRGIRPRLVSQVKRAFGISSCLFAWSGGLLGEAAQGDGAGAVGQELLEHRDAALAHREVDVG